MNDTENYLTCPSCNTPLSARYVDRGGLVYMQVGGVLLEHGVCANCGKRLFFAPSNEPLQSLIARWRCRRAELDALTAAAVEAVRRLK